MTDFLTFLAKAMIETLLLMCFTTMLYIFVQWSKDLNTNE